MYILKTYDCGKTAHALRDYMQPIINEKLWLRNDPANNPPVIRWGNSSGEFGDKDTKFNSGQCIHTTSSKLDFSKLCYNNGLSVITFHKNEMPDRYPVVIRQLMRAQGGKGIVVAKNEAEFLAGGGMKYWWSYFYKFSREFGVHMLGGKVVKIMEKIKFENVVEDEFPIRNNDNKYHYKRKDLKFFKELVQFCEHLYLFFPINMCRLDVGQEGINTYRVIEGNSAPSLNSVNVPIYGNYLLNKVFDIQVEEVPENE